MKLKTFLYFAVAIVLVFTGIGSILYLSFNILLQVLTSGVSWATFGIFVFYLLTSVPAFQGAGAWVARGLSHWKWGARSAVAFEIEKNLNSVQEEINSNVKGLVPYPAKVEWIDKPSYLDTEEEKVIIRMREYENNPRNVAYAVVDYISKGMIPFSRLYLEEPIQTAMDSTMIRSMLWYDESALDFFLSNVLNKRLGEEGVQHYMDIMDNLEKRGLFTRVFLEEVRQLGLKLYPMQDQDARREAKEYTEHLNILATRERGEEGGSAGPYVGKRIKVGYILVARPEKLRREGYGPYMQYALRCIEDHGVEAIYLLSRGENINPARKLADKMAKVFNLKIENASEYEEGTTQALCVELRTKKPYKD